MNEKMKIAKVKKYSTDFDFHSENNQCILALKMHFKCKSTVTYFIILIVGGGSNFV